MYTYSVFTYVYLYALCSIGYMHKSMHKNHYTYKIPEICKMMQSTLYLTWLVNYAKKNETI